MLLLWFVVSSRVASMVKSNITNQMIDVVESRAAIINDYVASAEEYLTAFSLGSEVQELLAHPEDMGQRQKGQKYTEEFAAVKGVFEGLYIGTPDTYILTHTSQGAIGMTTREGESLQVFRDTILAEPKLTNLGIMKSPGTGSMILSMYCPVFEGNRCIGYVGAGVYASRLMDALLDLEIEGLPNSEYVFLNAETGMYLYHENEELMNTEMTDEGYLEILKKVKSDGGTQAGTYSYQDEEGVNQLVVYKYLKDRDWVFMVRDNASEVYGEVVTVRITVGILCAVEAARVGDAGKGFSVVSDEVGNLASKSAEAAKSTGTLIGRSLQDVKTGTESTNLAISAVQVINDCIQSIKMLMDDITLASVQQSEMIVSVENRIKEVSRVIEANSDAAEESAAISNELSEQARTLNRLISQFRIK
ncbi:MAG: hypothetical protein HFH24_06530 [Ruminococcus sp.]|nr:hypothetical protein [Ruminococcus sp.]